MGSAISSISGSGILGGQNSAVNQGFQGWASSGGMLDPVMGSAVNNIMNPGNPPPAPGVNQNLVNAQQAQVGASNQYTQNLPNLQNQMGNQARQNINQQTGNSIQGNRSSNASRGMLYGGINQGQESGMRASGAAQSAQAQSNINANTTAMQQGLQQNAINTGLAINQNQQQIQNDIYQEALAQMQAAGSVFKGGMGLLGGGGGLAAGMMM